MEELLGNGSNFVFEEVSKDMRSSRKEELSSKFKELFKKRKETLEKEVERKEQHEMYRLRGSFDLGHRIS